MGFIPNAVIGLLNRRGANRQAEAQRRAQIHALELAQRQQERERIGRLGLGQAILGNLSGESGRSVNLPPELMASLSVERRDPWKSIVPREGVGSMESFLSGLLGQVRDFAPYMASQYATGGMGGDAGALSIDDLMAQIGARRAEPQPETPTPAPSYPYFGRF